jgi:hypothetical protein
MKETKRFLINWGCQVTSIWFKQVFSCQNFHLQDQKCSCAPLFYVVRPQAYEKAPAMKVPFDKMKTT